MRISLSVSLMTAILFLENSQAQEKRGKTADGREIVLKADGTWSYVAEYKKDKNASLAYKGKYGSFAIYLSPDTWKKQALDEDEEAETRFIHKDGGRWATIFHDRIEIPLEPLKNHVFENALNLDKKAKIVFEEKRTVNGKEILCFTLELSPEGIPVTFHVYLYSGDEGSIQVLTWTGRNLFKQHKTEMESFMNGLEIIKKKG